MAQTGSGRLGWFDFKAGYGYVLGDDGTKFIVHRRSLKTGYVPQVGDALTFSVKNVPAGKLAVDVTLQEQREDGELESPVVAAPAVTGPVVADPVVAGPVVAGPVVAGPVVAGPARSSTESIDQAPDVPAPNKERAVTAKPATPARNSTPGFKTAVAVSRRGAPPAAGDNILAQALLAQKMGNEKKARDNFEYGMKNSPSPQVITAYASFERNRSRPNAAREVLKRGLAMYPTDNRIQSHLLWQLGQLELRAKQPDLALVSLSQSISLAHSTANTGEQHRLLALGYATIGKPDPVAAWAAIEQAVTKGVSFTQAETRQLLPCYFGGSHGRLSSLLSLLDLLSFKLVAVGERLDASFVHRPPEFLSLFVRAPSIYSSAYDLADDLLVVCHLSEAADYESITQAESLFERRNANVNPTTFFMAFGDVAPLRQQLLRRAEQQGKAPIIPLHDELLRSCAVDSQTASTDFHDVLQDWLFKPDRFKSNQPVSGRNFFGREKVFRGVEAQIEEGRSVGIFGLRKIGKTSILKQLAERRPVDIVGYVDLQGLPPGVTSVDYVLWLIGNALAEDAASKYGPEMLESMSLFGKHISFPNGPTGLAFDGDLNRLASLIQKAHLAAKCRIIVMLDEVEKIIPLPNSRESDHRRGMPACDELFGYLRGKAQIHPWFISIVAGANAKIVEEPHWRGVDNPVFRFYQTVYLPPLNPEESSEMVVVLGRGMGMAFTPEALDSINRLSGQHPFVVRQLCSLLARTFTERPITVTHEHVAHIGATFALEEYGTFREMFERLERDFPDELEALRHLASVGGASLHELTTLFGPKIKEGIGHLCGYSLVNRDSLERYVISFPLLQEWVRENTTSSVNRNDR
jgi:hypothetical protein